LYGVKKRAPLHYFPRLEGPCFPEPPVNRELPPFAVFVALAVLPDFDLVGAFFEAWSPWWLEPVAEDGVVGEGIFRNW
jgi:hypothetical protein